MKFFRRKRSRLECENDMLRYQLNALKKAIGDRKITDSVKPCYSEACSHCRFSLSVDGYLIGPTQIQCVTAWCSAAAVSIW